MTYSKKSKDVLHGFIDKEYGSEAEKVWENVLKKYAEFMAEAPDYGEKSPHAAQICGGILLMSFCVTAPKEYTLEELQPMVFEMFMSPFKTLGKFFDANKKWVMNIANMAFQAANVKSNKHAETHPADFTAVMEPYDKENGIVRYSFTRCPLADFAKRYGLEKWLPLCCNCDHIAMHMIHANLIRVGTCATSDVCDYCISGDKNPIASEYELVKDENGLLVSRKKDK